MTYSYCVADQFSSSSTEHPGHASEDNLEQLLSRGEGAQCPKGQDSRIKQTFYHKVLHYTARKRIFRIKKVQCCYIVRGSLDWIGSTSPGQPSGVTWKPSREYTHTRQKLSGKFDPQPDCYGDSHFRSLAHLDSTNGSNGRVRNEPGRLRPNSG